MDAERSDTETSMKKIARLIAGATVAIIGAACAEIGTPAGEVAGVVAAFESVPAGFSATSSSFAREGDLDEAFHPHRGEGAYRGRKGGDDREHGGRGRRDG